MKKSNVPLNDIGILIPLGINNSLKRTGNIVLTLLATLFLASFFKYSRYFLKIYYKSGEL